ncbi:hypothetical protein JL720_4724 [Aureococcus anophagefferens]|nr:hypothetical protein JL720_4724 [Aureococcus anophagefferens]
MSSTARSPKRTTTPVTAPQTLTKEQSLAAVLVAYAALKAGAGASFTQMVCSAVGVGAAYVASAVFQLDGTGSLEVGVVAAFAVSFLVLVLGPGAADLVLLGLCAASATRPETSTFDGDALKQVYRAAARAAEEPKKAKGFFSSLKRKALRTFDDVLASLGDRAADIVFYDLKVCHLAKVTPPGADEPIYVVGAFDAWHNVNAVAIHVNKWLEDFGNAHATAANRRGGRAMLVRIPNGAAPGSRLSVVDPRGQAVEFVVPPGARPGAVIQLSY